MSVIVSTAVGWAFVAATFSFVTAVRVWRVLRQSVLPREDVPAVLLLRPVDSPNPVELANLQVTPGYRGQLESVVVGPVCPPLAAGVVFVESNPTTCNRKVGHLLAALAHCPKRDRVVLSIDADVRVDGPLIEALAVAVRGGAALSFAAPEPLAGPGLAARAVRALLTRTHHAFRALDVMSVGAKAVCGKAVGLGPAALDELPQVAEVVGEDLELAARLFVRGERVELVAPTAKVPQPDVAWRGAIDRFTRWTVVLKAHRPHLFPSVGLLFAPTPALMVLALATGSPLAGAAVAVLAGARAILAGALAHPKQGEWPWADWLLGELLLWVAFGRAFFTRRVMWRGRVFVLVAGGRMVAA